MIHAMTGSSQTSRDVLEYRGAAPRARPDPRQWPAMLYAMLVFAGLSLAAGFYSSGFLEGDACTHYLYARFCLHEHHLLTNFWGRPFCTAIYALPAVLGGRLAVRATSMLIAVAMALVSYRIARGQGWRWPGLALIFVLGQPLVFLHSFSELTELPFALLLALAIWAYQSKQWLLMALIASIMPASRPEGFGFVLLAAAALLLHRRWRWIPLLVLPMALWSFWGWFQFGAAQPWYVNTWRWLPAQWPYASQSLYSRGPLLFVSKQPDGTWTASFLLRLPAIVSPMVFPAVLFGIGLTVRAMLRRPDVAPGQAIANAIGGPAGSLRSFWNALCGPDHGMRVDFLIASIAVGVLAVHSMLWWLGRMASNGEPRYMLVAAPAWALLGAKGWAWAFDRLNARSALGWAGLAALVPALVNGIWRVVPIDMTPEGTRAEIVAEWYRSCPWRSDRTRLIATCRDVYYVLDISPSDPKKSAEYWRPLIMGEYDNRGIVLVWDPIYGVYNADQSRSIGIEEIVKSGWIPVHIFSNRVRQESSGKVAKLAEKVEKDILKDWVVFLSPLDEDGKPRPRTLAVPLPEPEAKAKSTR